jgi:hypothetical protein
MVLVHSGARRFWAHSFPPLTLRGALELLSNPLMGQPSNSWTMMGCESVFSSVALLTYCGLQPVGGKWIASRHIPRGDS